MNRCFCLLIGVLVRLTTAQGQPVTASNAIGYTTGPVTPATDPRTTQATESPVYVKAYGFYNLLTPGGDLNYSYSQTQFTTPTAFKLTDKSLGAGPRVGIGLGYIVSDFINLGLDAEILFGTALKNDNNFFSGTSSNPVKYVNTINSTLKVLSVIPNVTFKALSRPSYYIYNRLGLVGGVVLEYKQTVNQVATPTKGAVTTELSTSEYTKNSLALGYQVALGIQFRLSQKLRAFAEAVAYNQSFKPQEIKGTSSSTTSGKTTTSSSTTLYKNEGDYNKSNPNEQPSFNVAINSVGLGAGLVLRF